MVEQEGGPHCRSEGREIGHDVVDGSDEWLIHHMGDSYEETAREGHGQEESDHRGKSYRSPQHRPPPSVAGLRVCTPPHLAPAAAEVPQRVTCPAIEGIPVPSAWQTRRVRSRTFNVRQRVVVVVGTGAALLFFGSWLTTRGQGGSGWVAYAPLSDTINATDLPAPGFHPWVRLLIWLALIAIWVAVGVVLLRTRSPEDSSGSAD